MYKSDEYYMNLAIKEARKAEAIDEVPVGAIIVDENGDIVARGYNKREIKNDPTSHAEIEVIRKACKKKKDWRLINCTLYVTIEPCIMCAGTIIWSRLKRVCYGAKDIKGGAFGGSINILDCKTLNHHPEICGDILGEKCSIIIKEYFKKKR